MRSPFTTEQVCISADCRFETALRFPRHVSYTSVSVRGVSDVCSAVRPTDVQ